MKKYTRQSQSCGDSRRIVFIGPVYVCMYVVTHLPVYIYDLRCAHLHLWTYEYVYIYIVHYIHHTWQCKLRMRHEGVNTMLLFEKMVALFCSFSPLRFFSFLSIFIWLGQSIQLQAFNFRKYFQFRLKSTGKLCSRPFFKFSILSSMCVKRWEYLMTQDATNCW